ncbi:MAG: MFS transporter [Deltaproteobacteria bacterium]|nr:MFS transporter [Deltaproteobacteria bacterium]
MKPSEGLAVRLTPLLVSVVTVLVYADTHALHPFLASYARALGSSVFMAGVIVAAYSVFEDLFEYAAGYLMDRTGRKRFFIFAGMLGDAVVMVLYGLVASPLQLLGVRLLHGLSGSVAGPGIMSLVAQIPHPLSRLGARMGLYGTSIILASIVGWVLGGLIAARYGYGVFFGTVSALLVLGALLTLAIREPEPLFPEAAQRASPRDALRRLRRLVANRGLRTACLGIFALMVTLGAMTALLPLRYQELGLSSFHVGMTLAAYGLAALVMQIPMGYFSERYGRLLTLGAGLAIVCGAMLLLSAVETFLSFVAVGVLYGAGYSFLFPTLTSMVVEESAPEERASASSLFHIMFTEGVVVGAFCSSWIAEQVGCGLGLRISAVAPFLFLVALLMRRRSRAGDA